MARVAIQIVLYRSSEDLPQLLQSLRAQTYRDWSLFVYENSCDADEQERVRRILETSDIPHAWTVGEKNTGFSAHNQLLLQHDAEYVFVLNPDAYLAPDCIEFLLQRMDEDSRCAAVTPLVYRGNHEEAETALLDMMIDTAGLEYRALGHVVDFCAGRKKSEIADLIRVPRSVFGVSGAAALYRRVAIMDVSPDGYLYDPSFFMYKEDVELALRLQRKGYTAWLEPRAIAFHRRSIGFTEKSMLHVRDIVDRIREERRRLPRLRLMTYRNQWMIYCFHLNVTLGFRDLFVSMCYEIARGILVLIASPRIFFAAWMKIIQDIPWAIRRRRAFAQIGLRNIKFL